MTSIEVVSSRHDAQSEPGSSPVLELSVVPSNARRPLRDDAQDLSLAIAARRLATTVSLWPGWSEAPAQVLLVTDSLEYLIGSEVAVNGFRVLEGPAGVSVQVRARVFPPTLLATFPAIHGIPTIVIGTPAATRLSPAAWAATLAHEHMHQWQYSRPGYYLRVQQLDLARGDTTGMWMLNFPVAYDDRAVGDALASYAVALQREPTASPVDVQTAWQRVEQHAGKEAARYLAFQFWQEGVARYTEEAFARQLATGRVRSSDPRLTGAHFAALADSLTRRRLRPITADDVARRQREIVYPIGAALAAWLDKSGASWRASYATRTQLTP